ncbi:unnamed protein product [Rhizophagus irregularis]|nr:unnamed protein product [Rhizophagus irregularis]
MRITEKFRIIGIPKMKICLFKFRSNFIRGNNFSFIINLKNEEITLTHPDSSPSSTRNIVVFNSDIVFENGNSKNS